MSISIYDPTKGCNVLNPANFTINAFHPEFIKTYYPELLSTIRAEATQKANGVVNGAKAKAAREAVSKAAFTVKAQRPNLKPTDFYVYQKAGMPKGADKCKTENPSA